MRFALCVVLAIVGLLILPFLVSAAWVVVLAKVLIAALFALAFNLLAGQAGMLSFGHAAYFAVGAFSTLHAMRAAEAGFPIPTPLLPIAGLLAGLICGVVCGVFTTLRSGVYFSMITLAIAELFYNLAPDLQGIFGGEGGISSFRMPWLGITFGSDRQVYLLVAAWFIIATGGLYYYTLTPFGRLTLALRENEQRVRFLGYNTYHSRIVVFAISAMVAGLAGGLLAVTNESGNYVLLDTSVSAAVVLNVFIGGSGVFLGPVLGATILTVFSYVVSDATSLVLLYEGAIFIIVMVFVPQGLGGALVRLWEPIREGWWPRLIGPYLAAGVLLAMLTGAVVFALELAERVFSGNQTAAQHSGEDLVTFLGYQLNALSPLTWALPAGLAVLSVLLLRPGLGWVGRVWSDDHP